jgi:hypothetical protein
MMGNSLSVNESQQTGTFAQATVHAQNKDIFQDYAEGIFLDAMDEQYAKDLLELNYDRDIYTEETDPTPVLEEPDGINLDTEIDKDTKLKALGLVDLDTQVDMNFFREKYGLPENEELFTKIEDLINNPITPNDPNNTDNVDSTNINNLYNEIDNDLDTLYS